MSKTAAQIASAGLRARLVLDQRRGCLVEIVGLDGKPVITLPLDDNGIAPAPLLADALSRRCLPIKKKRELTRAALLNGGIFQTDRAVAAALGFHHCFVAKVRRQLAAESGQETTTEGYRIGLDGKARRRPIPMTRRSSKDTAGAA